MKKSFFSETKKQFLLLVSLLTLSSIATDLYTPSFLDMSNSLLTTPNGVQWTITLFVLTLSLSHFFYGPLSDIFARKKVLLVGFFFAILGSLLCVFAQSIEDLYFGRLLQGFGLGAPAVLWRPILRDRFEGDELAREMSMMAPLALSAIIAAPFFGGLIQTYFSWRANFAYLLFHICVVSLFVFFFFEDKEKEPSSEAQTSLRSRLKFIGNAYKELFQSQSFLTYSFCCFLGFGAFFAWTVTAPVIFLNHMGISPYELGKILLIAALPLSFGGYLNGKYVVRFGTKKILRGAWLGLLILSLFILLSPYFFAPTVLLLLVPMFFFTFLSGFIWPNLFSEAFKPFAHISGVAASLYGLMQLLGGATFSALLSIVKEENQMALGGIMVFSQVLSMILFELLMRKKREGMDKEIPTVVREINEPKILNQGEQQEESEEISPKSFT